MAITEKALKTQLPEDFWAFTLSSQILAYSNKK